MKKVRLVVALAALLTIIISLYPALGVAEESGDPGHIKRLTGVLNINTASADQFMRLRGINAELANKVVAYREANGPFKAAEGLLKVEGFTEKLFSLNQGHLSISGETTLRWVRVPEKTSEPVQPTK